MPGRPVYAPPVMKYQISRAIMRDRIFICQLRVKSSWMFMVIRPAGPAAGSRARPAEPAGAPGAGRA